MPPGSTTTTSSPSEAPYTADDRPAGPAPTTSRSNVWSSTPCGAPAATAISAFDGSLSIVPSGSTISGRRTSGPACSSSSRPSSESASANACGTAQLSNVALRS